MICTTCGSGGQPEGARFCFSCGAGLGAPTCVGCRAEIVPGARFCSVCGTPQPATGESPVPSGPTSARRVTSVLFGDLVGFTTLSESRDQEDVRELLSAYFETCRQIVARYGGVVEKFIGDAVMAVWGVPSSHEDDAERAVRAGLELTNAVDAMGTDLGVPGLAMRVGIVTGEVAVTIGAQHQGMVAGDAVNTAARVQSVAAPGHVWVDETTRLLTVSAITYVDAGSHTLKGKAQPVPLWSVRAVVAAVGGLQRADGLEAPHVGRDRELRLVKEVFHGVEETGRPALLLVAGEPGVGKSRLGWEFFKYVDGLQRSVWWHSGRCLSYGEGSAFYALAEAIRGRLQAPDNLTGDPDDDEDLGVLLGSALARLAVDEEERAWLDPRMGTLLGIGTATTYPREDLFAAWTTFLDRLSGPSRELVVLVVDDAQHADDGTLMFVEHLLAVARFPCLVVMLTRLSLLDERPDLATNRRSTVLHLESLTDQQMSSLLDGLVANLPDGVRDSLVRRAEGIPLFAVETIRSMIDRDLVVPRGGQYVLADPESLDLDSLGAPASLQALIAARLDTLPADQRLVLDRASVLGESFSRQQVAALCPEVDGAAIEDVLGGLVRAQILQRESSRLSSELGKYQFVQTAVRLVAYGTLSRRERKQLHLAVVAQLEEESGEAAEGVAAILARHYLEAIDAAPDAADAPELTARAVARLRQAAARAQALGTPEEAAAHLRQALDRTPEQDDSAAIAMALATALSLSGRHEEALVQATVTHEYYASHGPLIEEAQAAAVLAHILGARGENERALSLASEVFERLRGHREGARAMIELANVISWTSNRVGRTAVSHNLESVRLAELLGDDVELARTYSTLATHFSSAGMPRLGLLLLREAIEIIDRQHDPVQQSRQLINLCIFTLPEDTEESMANGRRALAAARVLGDAVRISYSAANLLVACVLGGSWDEIAPLVGESLVAQQEMPMSELAGIWTSSARGEAWTASDSPAPEVEEDPGMAAYVMAVESWQLLAERPELAPARALDGVRSVVQAAGLYDDFLIVWHSAIVLASSCGDLEVLAELARVVTDVDVALGAGHRTGLHWIAALVAGEDEAADAEFRRAVELAERWGGTPILARIRADHAIWLARRGRDDEAAREAALASDGYVALRATAWMAELDRALAAARV